MSLENIFFFFENFRQFFKNHIFAHSSFIIDDKTMVDIIGESA